jgi:hypothetical protein
MESPSQTAGKSARFARRNRAYPLVSHSVQRRIATDQKVGGPTPSRRASRGTPPRLDVHHSHGLERRAHGRPHEARGRRLELLPGARTLSPTGDGLSSCVLDICT